MATVEQAVLGVLIAHYPVVANHVVQAAHPTYQMSGLARLRGLKQDGIVSYQFYSHNNVYRILTPRAELTRALEMMKRGEKDPIKIIAAMRGFKQSPPAQPASECKPISHPDPLTRPEGSKQGEVLPERVVSLEEIRRFRESLEAHT